MNAVHHTSIKLITTASFFIMTLICPAQNLVVNGDFETYTTLPNTFSQIDYCTGWNNTGGDGSPDYYHTAATFVQLPNTPSATVYPYSGAAVTGIVTYWPTNEFREYLSSALSKPMTKGDVYIVSFWVTNGIPDEHSPYFIPGFSCNHIGIRFSEHPLHQNGSAPINATPQLDVHHKIWSNEWKQFSFYFFADSAYQYLTLGNFYDDNHTNAQQQLGINAFLLAYYYLDKVEVTSIGPVVITLDMPNLITPNGDDINDTFTPILSLGITSQHTEIYNRWGSKVFETDNASVNWNGEDNSDGIYYWHIRYTDYYREEKSICGIVTVMR